MPPSKKSIIALLFVTSMLMQFCKLAQKSINTPSKVSYTKDVLPIMKQSCTPCHFQEQEKNKMLNTYQATKRSIVAILIRIQLPTDNIKSMPFKQKNPPLTAAEIQVFKDWVEGGMEH